MTQHPAALALLRDAESYLSALHGSVARHDVLAANLGCAGCELRDRIAAALPTLAVRQPPADRAAAVLPLLRPCRRNDRHDAHDWQQYGEPLHCLGYAPPADRAAVYAEVADRLAADAEQGDKDGLTRIYRRSAARQVRVWAAELRRMADEAQPETEATEMPVDERHDDTGPVKEATRRYAAELRSNPGTVVADGHTGWECDAGASLIVEASTPGPGKLGTHHGVIYACASHRAAAMERITGAGYEVDPRPAPPGHRWNPWPCGHVTAHDAAALAALAADDEPAAEAQQDGAQR